MSTLGESTSLTELKPKARLKIIKARQNAAELGNISRKKTKKEEEDRGGGWGRRVRRKRGGEMMLMMRAPRQRRPRWQPHNHHRGRMDTNAKTQMKINNGQHKH